MKKMVILLVTLLALVACTSPVDLVVLHAGSLAVPYAYMAQEFEEANPGVTVVTESAGSRTTIRKVTEMDKPGDVIGSADYVAIEELMFPDYADWYICFATNEMVIAYTEQSKYHDEINENNWYEILLREDVTYGHSDPDADPCGYRTLMMVQLAQSYYYDEAGDFGLTPDANASDLYDALIPIPEGSTEMDRGRTGGDWGEVVRPKSVELLYLLDSGDLDYAFEYRSVAVQHEYDFVSLPEEIDLSSMEYEEFYATATVKVTGKEPGTTATQTGATIVYGVTIPSNAPHPDLAIDFLELMLGPQGQAILEDCGQPPIVPAIASHPMELPEELREFVLTPF